MRGLPSSGVYGRLTIVGEGVVTSRLLEAFLACPVDCPLLSGWEVPAGTEYSAWSAAREESCRREGLWKLTSQEKGPSIAAAEPGLWKRESWRLAVGKTLRAEGWKAESALIQRIPLSGAPSRFVPIRFAANSRLSPSDKAMAAFETIALAKALGTKTGIVPSAGSMTVAGKTSSGKTNSASSAI